MEEACLPGIYEEGPREKFNGVAGTIRSKGNNMQEGETANGRTDD